MLVSDSSHENCRQHNSSGETGMAWPSIPQKTTYSVAAVAGRRKVQEGVSNSAPLCELQSQTNVRRGSRRGRRANAAGGRPVAVGLRKSANLLAEEKEQNRLGLASKFLGISYLVFNRDFVSSRSLRSGQCTSIKCNQRRAGKSASIVETWCMAPKT